MGMFIVSKQRRVPRLKLTFIRVRMARRYVPSAGDEDPGMTNCRRGRFEFIPMWGYKVFFVYAPRRVECLDCGIRVEKMPWVHGKRQLTDSYAWYLASWAKKMSWQEVAKAFRSTWDHVFNSVEMAVNWGREHQDLSGIKSIGVDEIQWQNYLTLVYQIDAAAKRLLWVGEKRTIKTILRFFRWFGK
jgi:transposase